MLTVKYLLESAFCLACLYALYWLVLRRETFFQWNRVYLLLAPVLALAAPALHIPLEQPPLPASSPVAKVTTTAPVFELPVLVEQVQAAPRAVGQALEQPLWSLTLGELLWCIYAAVAVLLLLHLAVQVGRLLVFIRRCRRSTERGVVLAKGPEGTPLASFFGFVFWHPGDAPDSEQRLLFEHEMVHVRQWHSLDLILMELLLAFQWFNPLLYAYRRSLRDVHEYIADAQVVRRTRQRYAYARLLACNQTKENANVPLLVNTFHSRIQNRLIMLAKHPSGPLRRFKYLLAVPVCISMLLLFSFRLIERLPAAAPVRTALQQAERYAASLSEVTVVAPASDAPEPTPYILYWGAFQAAFLHFESTDTYLAQVVLSPEELKEAIQREPRLWTGQTLEQHLSLEINGFEIRSNYYQPEVYQISRAELSRLLDQLAPIGYLKIDKIRLPGGKFGEVHISLTGEKPGWIPPKSTLADPKKPAYKQMKWGNETFHPAETRFATVDQFWAIVQSEPKVFYQNGAPEKTPQQWNLAVFNASGHLVRPLANREDARTLEALQNRLLQEKDRILPGVKISLAAWDVAEQIAIEPKTDTIITLDPETYQETMWVARTDGSVQIPSTDLVSFHLVAPDDPRLFLRDTDTHNFTFDWGSYSAPLGNRYGRSYTRADGSGQIFADLAFESFTNRHTRTEILDMLRRPARFYQDGILLESLEFTLRYKDQEVTVRSGQVPGDLIQLLERDLRTGDQIRISGLRAGNHPLRQIIAIPEWFATNGKEIEVQNLKQLDVQHFGAAKLQRFHIQAEAAQALQQQIGNHTGAYFQTGDINLGNVTLVLEVRSDDPKPPLRPATTFDLNKQPAVQLQVSPNPAHDQATLEIQLIRGGTGLLSVVDASGVVRFSLQTEFHAGVTPFKLPLNQINAKGVLYVRLEMAGGASGMVRMVVE